MVPPPEVPGYCVAGGLVGLGSVVIAAAVHDKDKADVPKACVGASLLGVGAVSAAALHHGVPSVREMPPTQCVVGGLAGLGALGYLLFVHCPEAEKKGKHCVPPAHCVLASVGIAGLAAATSFLFAKKA